MKKTNKELSPEEQAIEQFLSMNRNLDLIPSPNRVFKVKESVEIGSLKNCVIIKSLFEGKAYLIGYTSVDNNYGNPIEEKDIRGVWSWLDIFKVSKKETSLVKNKDLQLNYFQTGLHGLIIRFYNFGVEMNPEYQRDYVWEKEDKENLIDSIFNNRDIGKFVFIKLKFKEDSPSYEILDGKQRINALKEFYEDKILYKGLKYSELSRNDRHFFTNYPASICDYSDCDLKQKLKIFYHLNISGKVMGKEHLEKINKKIKSLEKKK